MAGRVPLLVGGVAQVLLGAGIDALAQHMRAPSPGPRAAWSALALWNAGTVAVAAADLAGVVEGVMGGGIALFGALTLLGLELRRMRRLARRPAPSSSAGYGVLLALLAASVVVGTALADAHPG